MYIQSRNCYLKDTLKFQNVITEEQIVMNRIHVIQE